MKNCIISSREYNKIHVRIRKRFPKPKNCNKCEKKQGLELSNTGHTYKEDLSDWEWLCHKCHAKKDRRTHLPNGIITEKNEEIRTEYLYGLSMAAIGKKHGITSMAVLFRLRRMGIKTRPRGEFKRRMAVDIRESVIACWKKHDGKITRVELARELGLSPVTVRRHLNRLLKEILPS